jgi:hypothetical protein
LKDSVALKSIKVYANASLDDLIVKTASILSASKSALSELFCKIVGDEELLKPADVLEY